jgi:hypothetical protein
LCIHTVHVFVDVMWTNMHGVHFEVESIQMQIIVGHTDLGLERQVHVCPLYEVVNNTNGHLHVPDTLSPFGHGASGQCSTTG